MPSKGGGDTEVMVRCEPGDFDLLLKAMAAADEAATLHAIGEVLVARTTPVAAKPPVVGFQVEPSAARQSEAALA
jgi:hypothetical protein